jgi:predicted ATPase
MKKITQTRQTLGNFKGISGTQDFSIKPITLIFGPNNAGKSSIMEGIAHSHFIQNVHLEGYDQEDMKLLRTSLPNPREKLNKSTSVKTMSFGQACIARCSLGVDGIDFYANEYGIESRLISYLKDLLKWPKIDFFHSIDFDLEIEWKLNADFSDTKNPNFKEILLSVSVVKSSLKSLEEIDQTILLDVWENLKLPFVGKFHLACEKNEREWTDVSENATSIILFIKSLFISERKRVGGSYRDLTVKNIDLFFKLLSKVNDLGGFNITPLSFSDYHVEYLHDLSVLDKDTRNVMYFSKSIGNEIINCVLKLIELTNKYSLKSFTEPVREIPDEIKESLESQYYNMFYEIEEERETDWFEQESLRKQVNSTLNNPDLLGLDVEFVVESFKSKLDENRNYNSLVVRNRKNCILLPLKELGTGLSQLVPILTSILNWDHGSHLIQQPELHLHPGLQSRLARVFTHLYKENRFGNLIIETHSEHLIKALQLEVTKYFATDGEQGISKEDINILYVSNNEGEACIREIKLDENGSFTEPWPDDFFELSGDLTMERLRSSAQSRN